MLWQVHVFESWEGAVVSSLPRMTVTRASVCIDKVDVVVVERMEAVEVNLLAMTCCFPPNPSADIGVQRDGAVLLRLTNFVTFRLQLA